MTRRFELTMRGRLALLLLHLAVGAAWLSGDDNARIAASMLAAPILVDLIATLLHRPCFTVRVGPRRTVARAPFLEQLRIRNESSSMALREVLLREPRTHVLDAGGAHLPWLAPGGEITVLLAARSPRRGRFEQRTFVATSEWPLGMFRWHVTIGHAALLVTEPARWPLPRNLLNHIATQARTERASSATQPIEFWGLREYREGEDARHVHAARSASIGTLVRKSYRGTEDRICALIVDLRRPPAMPPTFGRNSLESCLSRAAALVDLLVARGAPFHCVTIDAVTHRFTIDSRASAAGFLELLANARTTAFRAIGERDLDVIADVDACFWLAAGSYEDGVPRGRPNLRILREDAS